MACVGGILIFICRPITRLLKKLNSSNRPNRKKLENALLKKYGTTIRVTSNSKPLNELLGETLETEIKKRRKQEPGELIRIGIICGPMATEAFKYFARKSRYKKLLSNSDIQFVAMNRAGDANRYMYAANYQVTMLSELFKGSKALAFTSNPYDEEIGKDARNNVEILLCSAGRVKKGNDGDKSYITEWHYELDKYLKKYSDKNLPEFTRDIVGDFCLTPIDYRGRIAGSESLMKTINKELDPYPKFAWLGMLFQSYKDKRQLVIFPVRVSNLPKGRKSTDLPEKERVVMAILRSRPNGICCMDYNLAWNLCRTIGDYIIDDIQSIAGGPEYLFLCQIRSLSSMEYEEILAFDPNGKLKTICQSIGKKPKYGLNVSNMRYPKIIVSEFVVPPEYTNNEKTAGNIICFYMGNEFKFTFDAKTRKPGQWSLATFATVSAIIKEMFAERTNLKVHDIGCGCGIVGILCAKLLKDNIESILCTDIQSSAVECAKVNADRHDVRKSITFKVSDMFKALTADDKFDIIVFNPPFAPNSIKAVGYEIDLSDSGTALAKEYCRNVYKHLKPGGVAILTIADYSADFELEELLKQNFDTPIKCLDRVILYPERDDGSHPQPIEVKYREKIEKDCNYHFEVTSLGNEGYITFKMRHYIAVNDEKMVEINSEGENSKKDDFALVN